MVNLELSATRKTIVGVQFLFVAFSSTVLVPLLVGLDPATALFTAGIGTLLFHLVTKGAVPIFLGSSFAFIASCEAAISSRTCKSLRTSASSSAFRPNNSKVLRNSAILLSRSSIAPARN